MVAGLHSDRTQPSLHMNDPQNFLEVDSTFSDFDFLKVGLGSSCQEGLDQMVSSSSSDYRLSGFEEIAN